MFGFMDYVQQAFYSASHWDNDNSYANLTATAQSLLDFDIPRGLRLHLSSLSSPNFASSYTLASTGLVDGSLSYLYSSLPLSTPTASAALDLRHLIRGYRHLSELRSPDDALWREPRRAGRRNALLYGRLYLPGSTLEALYIRRLSATRQLKISCVSDASLANGGTALAVLQHDCAKYSTEYLYSTDSCLLGIRGLYNFGPDPRLRAKASAASAVSTTTTTLQAARPQSELGLAEQDPSVVGRFSAGAEVYYGLLNKSGGVSTGVRFTTLPKHTGFPYTMTVTLNPLMGNLCSTYAVKAGRNLALCSRFDFNFYSYESGIQLGLELWRRKSQSQEVEWAVKKMALSPFTPESLTYSDPDGLAAPGAPLDGLDATMAPGTREPDEDVSGVLKAKIDQNTCIGILWECRIKELLFTLGASFDLRRREQIFRGLGVEVAYSS